MKLLSLVVALCVVLAPGAALANEDRGGANWDELPIEASPAPESATDGSLGAASDVAWKRLAGADRYQTMAAIAAEAFDRSEWAVIAAGDNYPDALCASALAGARDCPLILTKQDALGAQAEAQLQRLGVKKAYVVGGTSVVSAQVEAALVGKGIAVTRLGGEDRYATAIEVFEAVREATPSSASNTVVVATGTNFADALSIGPWAYATSSPVLLTQSNGLLTDPEVRAIWAHKAIGRVLLVGGTKVVRNDVSKQLSMAATYEFERLGGENRYETSAQVATWEVSSGTLGWGTPVIATGRNFPDALAAATLAGRKASVLLVANSTADASVRTLREHKDAVTGGYLCGGTNALPMEDPFAPTLRESLESAVASREVSTFGGHTASPAAINGINAAINGIRSQGLDLGFVMMDLTTLKGMAYNCDALFYGASSIKGPYFASVINVHPEALYAYQYDIQETLFYSWDYNYKQVYNAYGKDPMRVFCAESGARASIAESLPWANYSARDLALMWARTYLLYGQSHEGDVLGSWCERPNISTIHATLGGKYRTRSKAGWTMYDGPIYPDVNDGKPLWNVSDDGGIVYAGNKPYLIAIMSNVSANHNMLDPLTAALDAAHGEM